MALKSNNSSIIPSKKSLADAYMALKATLGNKIAPYPSNEQPSIQQDTLMPLKKKKKRISSLSGVITGGDQ